MKDNVVILFTRIPVAGKTKTRLMPKLTGEDCVLLHRAFLLDIYAVLLNANSDCDVAIFYEPCGDMRELVALLPNAVLYHCQNGDGLGEKMNNAIKSMHGLGYKKCLLIGSDIPLLKTETIIKAFESLNSFDVVLGPSNDGGYYMIGTKEPCAKLFSLDKYGISSVLDKTIKAAASAGKSCFLGPRTLDVDEPEDLCELIKKLYAEPASVCIETRKVLKHLFIDE